MGRRVEHSRNSGTWTEARFRNFVRSSLRAASRKWGPINQVRKEAWVSRGKYKCNGCKKVVAPTTKIDSVSKPNIFVDHINPVVDPSEGFVSWDVYIDRLFCEKSNLQVLCRKCHDKKTAQERKKK